MVRPIAGMPAGTIGFSGSGKLTPDDYTEVLLPPLREAIAGGEPIRLLFWVEPDFDGLGARALWEDVKAEFSLGIRHPSAWKRIAIVSDAEWVRRAGKAFGWLVPGEFRLFPTSELDAAKEWVGVS